MLQEKETICAKIENMRGYYHELLEATSEVSLETYLDNSFVRRGTERIIQLIVECATDINCMILKGMNKPAPKDYFNSFIELGEADVFPMTFVLAIAPSTGLRNILVHEYQKVDNQMVYHSVRKVRELYAEYMEKLVRFLEC